MEKEIIMFLRQIKGKSALQEKNIQKYIEELSDEERRNLIRRIKYFLNQGEDYNTIANCYLKFCSYFLEERKYFVKNGTYRYSTYKEIAHLYEDEEYMKNYMTGLSLALYLWRIQRENLRFFSKKCQKNKYHEGRYLEVGPGHGEYLAAAVEKMSFNEYLGVDISSAAVEMTNRFLSFAYSNNEELLKKITVEKKDFFDFNDKEKFDAIVISEVLEHVENPKDFLVQVKNLSKEDTFIYLSTAINSPFQDHLYHFHSKEEVYDIFSETGFKIVDENYATADGISLEKAIKKDYDIAAGYILKVS